jgi:hypothetical protein
MVPIMIGPMLLFAAMASTQPRPATPGFRPVGGVTARATASVRIVSGVRFGPGRSDEAPGASRRKALLTDSDGRQRPAELLEFQ